MPRPPWSGRFTQDGVPTQEGGLWGLRGPDGAVIVPFAYACLRFCPGFTEFTCSIWIAQDPQGGFTVYGAAGEKCFGPIGRGEVPAALPPQRLALDLAQTPEQQDEHWYFDLQFFAHQIEAARVRQAFGPIDWDAPSLAALAGRFGPGDEGLMRQLGLWGRSVEILEPFDWAGQHVAAGTRGTIGSGLPSYLGGGLFDYRIELPVCGFVPGAAEKTLGIAYDRLRSL